MLRMEGFRLPKLFMVSGYTVYFWSNENGEPIHVHVSKGKSTQNGNKHLCLMRLSFIVNVERGITTKCDSGRETEYKKIS